MTMYSCSFIITPNMNQTLFTPLSLSKLLKEKKVETKKTGFWWCQWSTKERPPEQEWELEYVTSDDDFVDVTGGSWERYKAFSIGELPDVFRQVFDNKEIKEKINGEEGYYQSKAESNWDFFCSKYFKDPKTAWETLEKTIRSL